MPSELERATTRFRRSLLAQDKQSRAAVQRSYRAAIASLRNELRAALDAIAAIRAEGGEAPTWRLLQEQRVRQLLARAEIEFARHAATVQQTTIAAQQDAIRRAQDESVRLIEAGFGPPPAGAVLPIHTLPLGAIQELTAALQPNAPVRRLLQEFAGDAVEAVQDELVGGVAAGNSPYQITRAITNRLGREQRARAERVVRTEAMRAYREASRATMVANKHLMRGWIWYSALGRRTCAVCWALHGKRFDVDVKMATHPNCRCVLMPETKSWRELGYDAQDAFPFVDTGPELFANLSADEQHAILGPGAYAAYRAGDVALPDFVGVTRSQVWGTGRRRVSLATAQGRASKRDIEPPKPPPTKRMDVADVERTFFRPDFHDAVRESWQSWARTATPDEIDALTYYKGAGYGNINQYLRDGTKRTFYYGPDLAATTADQLVPLIDAALARARLPVDARVMRGMRLPADEAKRWADMKPGQLITDKGFVSTTYDEDVFSQFAGKGQGGVHVTIYAPKGSSGLYVDEISSRVASQEAEILFPRDTTFRVHRVRPIGDTGAIEVVLEVVP